MSAGVDVLVVGGGRLSSELVYALSLHVGYDLTCAVASRDLPKAVWLAQSCNARARSVGGSVRFLSAQARWEERGPEELLGQFDPRAVIHLASLQSPWEPQGRWTDLIETHGFGITTVRHTVLALAVARAIVEQGLRGRLVNGCYPDFVNQIIDRLGYPVLCGLGNISIVDGVLREALDVDPEESLRIVAHHYHVGTLIREPAERECWPMVWRDGTRVDCLPERLQAYRIPHDHTVGRLTAVTILPVLWGVLGLRDVRLNLAAPLGLPGGYPVTFEGGELRLDLPIPEDEAVAFNKSFEVREGVEVGPDCLRMADGAVHEIQRTNPSFTGVFSYERWLDDAAEFEAIVADLSKA